MTSTDATGAQQQQPVVASAASEKKDLSLNINAKPFTPGAPTAAPNASNNTNAPKRNNFSNNTNATPFMPPPPVPMNPYAMMGGNLYAMNPYTMGAIGPLGMMNPAMMMGHGMMVPPPLVAATPTVTVGAAKGGSAAPPLPPPPSSLGAASTTAVHRGAAPFYPPPPQQMVPGGGFGGGMGMYGGMGVPPSPMFNSNSGMLMTGSRAPSSNMGAKGSALPSSTGAVSIASGGTATAGGHASNSSNGTKGPKAPITFPRKVAFLILGGRGSGKSTQCERIAKQYNLLHIAGGQFVAEKKLPYVELLRVLRENFVEGAELGKARALRDDEAAPNSAAPTNNSSPDNNNTPPTAADTAANGGTIVDGTPNNATTPQTPSAGAAATTTTAAKGADQPKKGYNGLILDRMVGLHEYDAYYLDYILRRFGFAVELVFLLMLDSEIATQRAISRGDGKPVDHTRQMAEHRVQYAAVNTVYSPLKILHCVECDNMPVEAITRALERVIETHLGNPNAATTTPPVPQIPHHPYTQGKCKVVTDFEKFYALRHDMLVAVHNDQKPAVVCPASLMSGIADRRMFVSAKQARALVNTYATLKADGQRVLLFKKTGSGGGVYGINGIFHFMYDFTPYFEAIGVDINPSLLAAAAGESSASAVPEHGIEWVLDAEVFSVEGRTQIAVFDYLYLFGNRANAQLFETRLQALTEIFSKIVIKENPAGTKALHGPSPLFLKQYVPATALAALLPDPTRPPFPIDGVVFQHFGGYRFGRDNAIYKWKPREKCTVDFRLDKAMDPTVAGGEWTFTPMVGEDKEEVPWPNAQVRATDADARRCDLCDGAIAECIKREMGTASITGIAGGAHPIAIWDFVRLRPEKPTPNRLEIARAVDSMQHMSFEELAKALSSLGGRK